MLCDVVCERFCERSELSLAICSALTRLDTSQRFLRQPFWQELWMHNANPCEWEKEVLWETFPPFFLILLLSFFSYARFHRLDCRTSNSTTCSRLRKVYDRRCSLRCHDLRKRSADCGGSHVPCFLRFEKELQKQGCSVLGISRRSLPPPLTSASSATSIPDRFDDGGDDDDEEDRWNARRRAAAFAVSSSSSVTSVNSSSVTNGTVVGRVATSSGSPTTQDNTLFYVLIALMAALIFLVIVGIALMCMWWQPKSNSNYVEPDEDEPRSKSSAF